MSDNTDRSKLQDRDVTCSCRDRDTRVLRAIIAAASLADDATPVPPDRHTDLHRPEFGNSGNTTGRLVDVLVREGVLPGDLLMAAWMTLPGVPMAAQTLDEVRTFVADVDATVRQAGVARQLAREVHAAVLAQREIEWNAREDARRMRERAAELAAKVDGTYWRQRDGRRVARQPTHVLVDPDAWRAMKDEARSQHITVGELAAEWVREMEWEPSQRADGQVRNLPNRGGQAPLKHLVCRLAISRNDWAEAKTAAASRHVTIARYVGLVVEECARDLRRTARLRRRASGASRRRRTSS